MACRRTSIATFLFTFVLLLLEMKGSATNSNGSNIPDDDQHVSIVLLHRRGVDCNKIVNDESISLSAGQREAAARWAAEIITNQTKPHLFTIEIQVMDTCGSVEVTAKRSLQVVRQSRSNGTAVLGVIALEEADVLAEAARVLRRHNIPLVVATPKAAESEAASILLYSPDDPATQPDNVFSAVPNTAAVARATMAVARGIQSSSVRILGTCWRTIRMAERAARHLGMRVTAAEHYTADYGNSAQAFLNSLALLQEHETDETMSSTRVALLMEPDQLTRFMSRAVRSATGKRTTWLLGCTAGAISPQTAAQWALDLSSSAFLVEPHLLELAGLAEYMQRIGIAHHPLDNEIPHIVQAVSALGAAFHLQELATCVQSEKNITGDFDCHPTFKADPARVPFQMLSALRQLSMPTAMNTNRSLEELEGTSNHFTPSGRLVANRYLVQKLMAGSGESSPVAWYSDDDGLVLAAIMSSQSRFDFFGHASSGPILSSLPPFIIDERIEQARPALPTEQEEDNLITASPSSRPLFVQGRTWAASILAVSATQLLACFYIFVVLVWRSKNDVMSILLLIIVMAQLVSVAFYVLPAMPSYCKLFLAPLFLVTAFALLLAKLLQFRHLASAGIGGTVPQCPLYVAVLLAVAVQAAVSAHFYTLKSQAELITPLLYLYLMIFVTLTSLYASTLRQIRQQNRQAQHIFMCTLACAGQLLLWALVVVVLADVQYHDALTAALIVILSATTLGAIFVPKLVKFSLRRRITKSTYACNIRSTTMATSPWLDYNFTTKKLSSPPPAYSGGGQRH